MTDRLKIQVPEGTTEIDLRPILVPIVRALLDHTQGNGRRKYFTEVDALEFIDGALTTADFYRRVLALRSFWIASWLQSQGWTFSHANNRESGPPVYGRFREEVYTKSKSGSSVFSDAHVFVPHDDLPPTQRLKALLSLLRDAGSVSWASQEDTLGAIEAHVSIIDQIAGLDEAP